MLSAVCSVVLSLVFLNTAWLIIPLFIGFAVGFSILFLAIVSLFSLPVKRGKVSYKPSKLYLWLLNLVYSFICYGGRMKIRSTGLEKLPDEPFLLVSNHISNLDNMVQCLAIKPRPLVFAAKEELFKAPVIGGMITKCSYILLTRKNARKDKASIEKGEQMLKNGYTSIGIYPEGHRGKSGELQEFHAASFRIALDTGCPVVVSAVRGTDKVHKRFPLRSTVVNFDVIDIIYPNGHRSSELSDEARNKIKNYMTEKEL